MIAQRARGAALVLTVVVAGCGGSTAVSPSTITPTTAAATTPAPSGPLRGVSLSPRTYDETGFSEFADVVATGTDFVERVGDIVEWEDPTGGALGFVGGLADRQGLIAISVTGVFDVNDGALLRPIDDAAFARYVAAARTYASARHPVYLGLGVEIDTQWRTHPEDFDRFVDLFSAVADAIHEASPDTIVFTAFQLERLSGMQGGMFGGENDPANAAWDLIDRFPGADAIGFTTYPGLAFADPADIPDEYYAEAAAHAGGRPIVFTEMGWQAGGAFAEWSGSEERQAAFLARFDELTSGVDVGFACWSFLYDQDAPGPFASMGLFRADGTPRPAWDAWRATP
jgi:hypothetical protein